MLTIFRDYEGFLKCTDTYASADKCPDKKDEPEDMALAVYALEYTYDPIVSIWFPDMPIKREIITIQEYERCSFKIGQGAGWLKLNKKVHLQLSWRWYWSLRQAFLSS